MENYTKGKNVEEPFVREGLPFKNLPENFLWMQVKGGSHLPGLIMHASGFFYEKTEKVVVWSGAGVAIGKAITCAELTKRQFSIPHQVTRITYKTDEEYWDPKVEGLEQIVVKRQIPVIHILLSMDEDFDTNQLGYQPFEGKKFWQDTITDADLNVKKEVGIPKAKGKGKRHHNKGYKKQ